MFNTFIFLHRTLLKRNSGIRKYSSRRTRRFLLFFPNILTRVYKRSLKKKKIMFIYFDFVKQFWKQPIKFTSRIYCWIWNFFFCSIHTLYLPRFCFLSFCAPRDLKVPAFIIYVINIRYRITPYKSMHVNSDHVNAHY